MITKTIGTGGDYATIDLALASIDNVDLTDDYTFDLITDINQSANMVNYRIYPMGYTVRLTSSYNKANKSDWQNWKKITLTSTQAIGLNPSNLTKVLGGKLEIDHLYVTSTGTPPYLMVQLGGSLEGLQRGTQHFHDIYFDGNYSINGPAFNFGNNTVTNWDLAAWNFKIWNSPTGLFGSPGNTLKAEPFDLENISIYNDSTTNNYTGLHTRFPITAKNIVVVNDGGGALKIDYRRNFAFEYTANTTIQNCADSDGSLASQFPSESFNSQANVTSSEFASILPSNVKFLSIENGIRSLSINASPQKGQAPLKVSFSSNVVYDQGTTRLGGNGTTSVRTNEDIRGFARPGDDNLNSIGASEQQYTTV